MIIWETTNACDLACRHCRAQAIAEHDPLMLNSEDAKRLLEQVESFGKPRPIFIFARFLGAVLVDKNVLLVDRIKRFNG